MIAHGHSFVIPSEFIRSRVCLRPGELGAGFDNGWLDAAQLVQCCLDKYNSGVPLVAAEESLAFLLRPDYDRADDLAAELGQHRLHDADERDVWVYLSFAWLDAHERELVDPAREAKMLADYFDYDPGELGDLIPSAFIPYSYTWRGTAAERFWNEFLAGRADHYRSRDR